MRRRSNSGAITAVVEARRPGGLPAGDLVLVGLATLYLAAVALIPLRVEMGIEALPRVLADLPVRLLLFALLWEAWRAQREPLARRFVGLILAAGLTEQVALFAWRLSHLPKAWETSPVPDLLQLGSYALLIVAVRMIPSAEVPWRSRAMVAVDVVSALTGVAILGWFFLHQGHWVLEEFRWGLGPVIELGYPILDVLLLLMWVGRAAPEGGWAPRAIVAGLFIASGAVLLGDLCYTVHAYSGAGAWAKLAGNLFAGVSSVGYLLAAVVARRHPDAFRASAPNDRRPMTSQLLSAGLALVLLVLLVIEVGGEVKPSHLVLLLGVAGLGLLTLIRFVFSSRTNERWFAERERLLAAEVDARTAELAAANARLSELVNQDPLTGVLNRRGFDEALARAWASGVRVGDSLAVLVLDVDLFKAYNDALGHPAGDACLREIAGLLKGATPRGSDLVARYGGEEFVVLCPHTDAGGAVALAERIVGAVRAARLPHPGSPVAPHVTVSVGGAAVPCTANRSASALLAAADAALYDAKRAGRDRAVVTLALPVG